MQRIYRQTASDEDESDEENYYLDNHTENFDFADLIDDLFEEIRAFCDVRGLSIAEFMSRDAIHNMIEQFPISG